MTATKTKSPIPPAEVEVLVPFHDVDAMHIVWHGNYLKYFEVARTALMESINYSYHEMAESGYAWPIIDTHSRYGGSATAGDRLLVTATLREWEQRLRISYRIVNAATGNRITRGSSTQVAVAMPTNEMCYHSPDILFEKLGITREV